jgi:DeoR family transcriptional regulator of aga operon
MRGWLLVNQKASVTRVSLIPAQRHAQILQVLRADRAASVQRLAGRIGASVSTIRRDLEVLEQSGLLERSFGGASLRPHALATLETGQAVAQHIAAREKEAIARLAVTLIEPHQAVLLDSGSTVVEVAREIARGTLPLTVITNDLTVGQILSEVARIRLLVTGGTVRPGSSTLLGPPGEDLLATIRADIAFVGAHAVTDTGFSETSLEVVRIKQAIMRASRRSVIVADHSKFGEPSVFNAGPWRAGTVLVTDDGVEPHHLAPLREAGVDVLIAPVETS